MPSYTVTVVFVLEEVCDVVLERLNFEEQRFQRGSSCSWNIDCSSQNSVVLFP